MFVKASELAGALKAARLFASEDETRMNICCVHLEAAENALRIVSTDGHTLWACEIPASGVLDADQEPWNIGLPDIDKVVAKLRSCPSDLAQCVLSEHRLVGTVYPSASDTFPAYHNVIPALEATVPGKHAPEFAAEYVGRCCEALALYSKGFAPELLKVGSKVDKLIARDAREGFLTPPMAWLTGGPMDPAFFYSPKFPAAFAVVMPRRGEEREAPVLAGFVARVREKPKDRAA